LQKALHTTPTGVSWLLTGYLLSASVATPILARLGDMYGKQRLLVIVFATLLCGSTLGALATSLSVMIAARVLQGAAGAIFPLAFSIVRDEFAPHRVASAIGLLSAFIGIGSGIGMAVGGPVVEHLSYHWLFWLPLIPSAIAGVGAAVVVPRSPVRAGGRVNFPAAALLSAWLLMLLLGVSEAPSWGWRSPGVATLLVGSVLTFLLWVRVESHSTYPLVDIKMMRIPRVWWVNMVAFLMGVQIYSMFVVIPPFLQTQPSNGYGFGLSVALSGLVLVPGSLSMLVVGLTVGRVIRQVGVNVLLVAGALIAAVPFAILAVAHDHVWQFWVAIAVNGIGIGFAFSVMPTLIMEVVPQTLTGVATGMNANIRTVGGAIGSAVIASVVASRVLPNGVPAESGYVVALALLSGSVFLAAGAAALAVRSRRAGVGATRQRGVFEPALEGESASAAAVVSGSQ
jgi:MFS family permease